MLPSSAPARHSQAYLLAAPGGRTPRMAGAARGAQVLASAAAPAGLPTPAPSPPHCDIGRAAAGRPSAHAFARTLCTLPPVSPLRCLLRLTSTSSPSTNRR